MTAVITLDDMPADLRAHATGVCGKGMLFRWQRGRY